MVLEVLKGETTLSELCGKYELVPMTVRQWKEEFLANAELAFNKEKAVSVYKEKLLEKDREVDELHRAMGKINAQLEWAKKNLRKLDLNTKRQLIDATDDQSLVNQCELFGLNRSSYYYEAVEYSIV